MAGVSYVMIGMASNEGVTPIGQLNMNDLLLTPKLHLPLPPQNLVARPRLLERFATGANLPLTLISAPAGYGKTTLLSEWIAAAGSADRVVWVSLDEKDNDTRQFGRSYPCSSNGRQRSRPRLLGPAGQCGVSHPCPPARLGRRERVQGTLPGRHASPRTQTLINFLRKIPRQSPCSARY